MKGIALIDLDNVLGTIDDLGAALRILEHELQPKADDWTLCLAFNTETVQRHQLSYEDVRSFARKVSTLLGDDSPNVELGMCLSMPQTADTLLVRLLHESPTEDAAGDYHYVALVSKDQGLFRSLGGKRLSSWPGPPKWDRKLSRVWGPKERSRRTPMQMKGKPVGPEAPAFDVFYSACVESKSEAAWAAERNVDVNPSLSLVELASWVEKRPWLLSQLGATTSSVRGVARMSQLPLEELHLGTFSKREGVELKGKLDAPQSARSPQPATVGIGAVHFGEPEATVASTVPFSLFAENYDYALSSSGLDSGSALAPLAAWQGNDAETVKVRFRVQGSDLVCEVRHGEDKQPKLWWLHNTAAKSVLRLRCADLLPGQVDGTAFALRSSDAAYAVSLCAHVPPETAIHVDRPIPKRSIGEGYWLSPSGSRVPVAVFCTTRPLQAGEQTLTVPLHQAGRHVSVRDLPNDFWALPLVVPK